MTSEEAIAHARSIFKKRSNFLYHNTGKLEAEFMELDLLLEYERASALDDALDEISAGDRLGPQPPDNIAFPPYGGGYLYAFIWKSAVHGSIYLKFSFSGTKDLGLLVLHSFHKERF